MCQKKKIEKDSKAGGLSNIILRRNKAISRQKKRDSINKLKIRIDQEAPGVIKQSNRSKMMKEIEALKN